MFTSLKSALVLASLSLAGTLALVGCVGDASQGDEPRDGAGADERVGAAQEAINNNWTPVTSEELPPLFCDSGSLMSAVRCSGRYCDNIATYCYNDGHTVYGSTSPTPFFSDENNGSATCLSDEWVTGITCTGKYCDNVSLQCTKIVSPTAHHADCVWTGWVSEENGGELDFPAGHFMAGAQCNGSYCDNMRFLVCTKGQ